jgi:FkbM family methyltransferase
MTTYTTKHGLIDINDWMMEAEIARSGEYMFSDIEACLPFVSGTVVDVGAHVGLWSIPMSKRASKVIAIEGFAETYDVLVRNLSQNNVKNVEVVCAMVGSPLKKYSAKPSTTSGTNRFIENGTISPIALDSLAHPTFVKIDVEGLEPDVLDGAQNIIQRGAYFFIEINPKMLGRNGYTARSIQDKLPSYTFYRFHPKLGFIHSPYIQNSFHNVLAVPKGHRPPQALSFTRFIFHLLWGRLSK